MSRTATIILVAVAAALCAAVVLLVWRPFDSRPAIAAQAPGEWQEQTTADPVRLTLSAAGDEGGVPRYWVTFEKPALRTYAGRLEGDTIVAMDQDTHDTAWVITYNAGADALLVARPDASERHILRRVSR